MNQGKKRTDAVQGGLLLVLNAAEGLLQIVIADKSRVLCAQEWEAPSRGTEILAPALAGIFQGLKITAEHVEEIACVRGPGSFTGIRLTLATAAALSRVHHARLAGLSYMQALACAASRIPSFGAEKGIVWVITHARRDLVHAQPFCYTAQMCSMLDAGREIPQPLEDVALYPPAGVAQRICTEALPTLLLGSGVGRYLSLWQEACPQSVLAGHICHPSCTELWQLATRAEYTQQDIEPLYVRPCDAVEVLPRMAEQRGEKAAEVLERLESLLEAKPAPL